MESIVKIDVYHIEGKPFDFLKFRRSWDDSIYMECGNAAPCKGFGNPLAGPDMEFHLHSRQDGVLLSMTSQHRGHQIMLRPHRPILLSKEFAQELLEAA